MEYTFFKTEMSQHEMLLNQMGADVKIIRGIMCYVKVDLESGVTLKYVYHINNQGNYFLQRISPYPMIAGNFSDREELIKIIGHDIKQFRNASNSSLFSEFLKIHKKINKISRQFEDLYLYYNTPHEVLEEINAIHTRMDEIIDKAKRISKRVYTDKEPDTI